MVSGRAVLTIIFEVTHFGGWGHQDRAFGVQTGAQCPGAVGRKGVPPGEHKKWKFVLINDTSETPTSCFE